MPSALVAQAALLSRSFYYNKLEQRYMICFGFVKWAAMSLPAIRETTASGKALLFRLYIAV